MSCLKQGYREIKKESHVFYCIELDNYRIIPNKGAGALTSSNMIIQG